MSCQDFVEWSRFHAWNLQQLQLPVEKSAAEFMVLEGLKCSCDSGRNQDVSHIWNLWLKLWSQWILALWGGVPTWIRWHGQCRRLVWKFMTEAMQKLSCLDLAGEWARIIQECSNKVCLDLWPKRFGHRFGWFRNKVKQKQKSWH